MAITTQIKYTESEKIFLFQDSDVIVYKKKQNLPSYSLLESLRVSGNIDFCLQETQLNYIAAFVKIGATLPQDYECITHRSVFAAKTDYSALSARARCVLNWRQNVKFCAKCGNSLVDCTDETACECEKCKIRIYPQNNPAIIVQVYKGKEQLLAHHVKHRDGLYTCVAGFLEPGETIEECVKREVFEETSLIVDNVIYRESQSWPFPHQLMIGCTAEWVSGEISVAKTELTDAQWFSPDNLPEIPTAGTLARKLILLRQS